MSASALTRDRPAILVRFATLRDAKDISEVLAAAFFDNELSGEYLFPRRRQYPEDYRRNFQHKARAHMVQSRRRVLVAIDPATSRIVGFASWERRGSGLPCETLRQRVARLAVQCWDGASGLLWPDRSRDAKHQAIFSAEEANLQHHWAGDRREAWHLDLMGVHPEAQGKGAGKALVSEGIRWGKEDGVCVSVISSALADRFYDKLGFTNVGSAAEGALKGMAGGNIKFFEAHLLNSELPSDVPVLDMSRA
jgi:GNAT superfamily N-acetyltransferase